MKMSSPNIEEANTRSTADETHSLDGNGMGEVNSDATSSSTAITSEEVARQIRAATDPLTKHLEKLRDFMLELHKDASRRNEETTALVQGPSRPPRERFDKNESVFCSKKAYPQNFLIFFYLHKIFLIIAKKPSI